MKWECHTCARVIDLTADDNCPVCGTELPTPDEVAPQLTQQEKDDLERLRRAFWERWEKRGGPLPETG
jgi:hypothetical protein